MTHIQEHCETPKTHRRRVGDLWACDCGQVYVLRSFVGVMGHVYKVWRLTELRTHDPQTV